MTFNTLVSKYGYTERIYQGIFALSRKVKRLEDYILHRNEEIDFPLEELIHWYESEKPIERLTKEVVFYGRKFVLFDDVFCPRYETELLIEEALKLKSLKGNYIDLCSGSGVIGITILKENPNLNGTLLDLSSEAIKNIHENLSIHNLRANVIEGDWYEYLLKNPDFQVITANFPYVSHKDKIDSLDDPPLALYAKKDGWEHYEKLLNWLSTNEYWRVVILECSAHHLERWKSIQGKFVVELIRDMNGYLRVAIITWK